MREQMRGAAVYFGVASPRHTGGEIELHYVRRSLLAGSLTMMLVAAILTASVIVIFDWNASGMVSAGLLGVAIWGAIEFLGVVRPMLPAGPLAGPPHDAVFEATFDTPQRLLTMVVMLPVFVGLAWLADHWELGALFVPGQPAGAAAAQLVGAALIARWERAHRSQVVAGTHSSGCDLYAISARQPSQVDA